MGDSLYFNLSDYETYFSDGEDYFSDDETDEEDSDLENKSFDEQFNKRFDIKIFTDVNDLVEYFDFSENKDNQEDGKEHDDNVANDAHDDDETQQESQEEIPEYLGMPNQSQSASSENPLLIEIKNDDVQDTIEIKDLEENIEKFNAEDNKNLSFESSKNLADSNDKQRDLDLGLLNSRSAENHMEMTEMVLRRSSRLEQKRKNAQEEEKNKLKKVKID